MTSDDGREPQQCPKCGQVCHYDGWGHVHPDGLGIGSCTDTSDSPVPVMPDAAADFRYTLRQFLIMRSLKRGANWDAAVQAVDQCIRNNPKWDGEEEKTYREWEDDRL